MPRGELCGDGESPSERKAAGDPSPGATASLAGTGIGSGTGEGRFADDCEGCRCGDSAIGGGEGTKCEAVWLRASGEERGGGAPEPVPPRLDGEPGLLPLGAAVLSREAAAAKVACGAVTERGMVAVALPAPRVGWRWSWSVDKAGVAVPPVSTRGALAKLLTGCAPAPTLVASPAQDIPLRDLD